MSDVIEVSDGRRIGYAECGDPQGVPIVYLHGAPGSRVEAGPKSAFASELAAAGVRFIGMERAGYGISTAQRGRRFVDIVPDIDAFADQLGLDTFAVIGWSSGGPHALAAGAGLPNRVSAVGVIASIAPLAQVGLEGWGERELVEQAIRDPEALRTQMKELAAAMRSDPAATSIALLGDVMCEDDVVFTSPPERTAVMLENLAESARGDYEGYADDLVAGTTDWAFDLTDVATPVQLLHGTNDLIVPLSHSRYLASVLPSAHLVEHDGAGHISVLAHLVALAEQLKTAS